jgi:hypothetical protein
VRKPDVPVSGSGQSGFGSFKAKLENLKIQGCLEHGKWRQDIKGPRQKKFKPKEGSCKNRMFRLGILDGPVFLEYIESN